MTSGSPSRCGCTCAGVPRDEKIIAKLELETNLFLNELDATVELLRQRFPIAEAA